MGSRLSNTKSETQKIRINNRDRQQHREKTGTSASQEEEKLKQGTKTVEKMLKRNNRVCSPGWLLDPSAKDNVITRMALLRPLCMHCCMATLRRDTSPRSSLLLHCVDTGHISPTTAGLMTQDSNCLLAGWSPQHPNNMLVYLRDGSAQTSVHAAILRQKLQIKLSISSSHSIMTLVQPVPALTL